MPDEKLITTEEGKYFYQPPAPVIFNIIILSEWGLKQDDTLIMPVGKKLLLQQQIRLREINQDV